MEKENDDYLKNTKWSFYFTTWSHKMQDNNKLEAMFYSLREIFIEWLNH